eukprot:8969658-Ditylum_brightwellii.AAC.1
MEDDSYIGFVKQLPEHVKTILGNFQEQDIDPIFWIPELNKGNVKIATDGLVCQGKGSYAIILPNGDKEFKFQGLVFRHPMLLALYCAKLSGIVALH